MSGNKCFLSKDHVRTCNFTPKDLVSARTIYRFLYVFTKGKLDSFAGLDDKDTLKGRNNIERQIEIYSILSQDLRLEEGEIKSMKARIE